MSERITFSLFDPIRFDVPSHCILCVSNPPVFHYEHTLDESTRQSPKKGYVCALCAMRLLERLQQTESQLWEEEETSLRAEDLDAEDLEQRRLTAFGSLHRN